jgi:signal transduction histidine kinase
VRASIFIKVFLGFWLVTIAILGSWMLLHEYLDSQPRAQWEGHEPGQGPPQRFVLRLMYRLQTAPDGQLPKIITATETEHQITIYLLDRTGKDLLERSVPPQVSELAAKLSGQRRRAFTRDKGQPMAAHELHRREQGTVRAVLIFPKRKHHLLGILIDNQSLRLALALLVSGLACFALSRLVTGRLQKLQLAAGRVADGDLDTRLNVRSRGGDETDELARSFNSMTEQLQARMNAQKQLLSDVSHELRSPLARMRVAIALAQDEEGKRTDYLRRMEHEAERLEQLIQQLLSSQQDNPELDKHIDLVALLQELCDDAAFEGEQQSKTAVLETVLPEAIVASSGDLLHKSFDNIMRNALRHTPANSAVRVTLGRDGDNYRIEVEDQGPGLPQQELERIFDEFYRVDSARTREDGGHGLGLSISRRALQIHNGKIEATNTGHGLRISVTLPVTP